MKRSKTIGWYFTVGMSCTLFVLIDLKDSENCPDPTRHPSRFYAHVLPALGLRIPAQSRVAAVDEKHHASEFNLILHRGLTIEAFAKTLGVDPASLSRWERGCLEPRGKYRDLVENFVRCPL